MNKKYVKGLLSLSLSGMMAASLAAPVFAAETPADAKAYITKQFDMPVGTTLPEKDFTFDLTDLQKDNAADSKTTLTSKKITIDKNTNKKTVEINGAGAEKRIDRYVAYTDLLTSEEETSLKTEGTGIYTFTIKEKCDAASNPDVSVLTDTSNKWRKTDTLTYSQAEYKATVYVKTDGTNNYISNIKVSKEKDDQGNEIKTDNEKKVDPSKPDDNIPGSGGLRFVNTYTEKIDNLDKPGNVNPDPENPTNPDDARDRVLSVGKLVSGDLADKTQKFKFTVKVTQPSLVTTNDETYKAKIIKADGTTDGDELTFTSGVAQDVNLSHGEKLVFEDLYVGTAFEAQETDADTVYTSSTYARLNGGDPTEKAKERALVKGNVSENTDTVVVVNTHASTSPTGIVVNNLPYILLVLGVIAGFAGYIASKRRREVR